MILLATFIISTTFADSELVGYTSRTTTQTAPAAPVKSKMESVAPQYNNRFGFSFDRLVFDRNKADSFYFGLDAWMPYFFSNSRNSHFGHLYETEVRLGYNLFYNGCDHITPLVGAGYQYNNVGAFHKAKFAYATAGVRYYHEFNTVFGWGFFLKGLLGNQFGSKEAKKFAWGIDLSMPFVFRFTHTRCWDITLEPFYLYMESNHQHQAVFGGRGTIGYQF